MISLFQAIIAFVLLGLGAFYYFKTRSSPETPKSDDFDPLEDVEAEPDIKPAKPSPAVADEPDIDLEPEVIVTPSKREPENEDKPVKPTPTTTPAEPLVTEKPKYKTYNKENASHSMYVFMDKQYTLAEAKAKCKSIGRRLCTDSEICEPKTSTIFQAVKGGNMGRMFRTWVGGKKDQACNDSGKNGAWRYVGDLAANRCQFGSQFERCGVQNQKLEGFACCGKI